MIKARKSSNKVTGNNMKIAIVSISSFL